MTATRSEAARIVHVDALRGFALFGILVVNSMVFASPYYGTGAVDPAFTSIWDRGVRAFVALFFETKFYLLFSFLFGYSFTLQMQSAERAGAGFTARILRRQAGLWLIGLGHAVFLFHGDILTTYAVLGLALLALRGQPEGRLLKIAKALVLVTGLFWLAMGLLYLLSGIGPGEAGVAAAETARRNYTGSAATVVAQHLGELSEVWIAVGLMQGPCALAMFLIGFVAGRRQMLAQPQAYRPLLRRLVMLGVWVGLPTAGLYAYASVALTGSGWEIMALGLGLLTAPFLTGAYVALMLMGFDTPLGDRVARILAPAGRMALSNYLLQSLACSLIFTAYGLRLIGQLSPLVVLEVCAAIFALQLIASRWWLQRFAYGPVEWGLRALTIAAWPRWRLNVTQSKAA